MLSDLCLPDGSPWAACPRTFLREAVAALAGEGHALVAAYEPEFTLGHRVPDPAGGPDRLVPVDDSLCYSTTGFNQAHDYTMALVHALESQGLRPEHCHPELGHGQQELSIRHAPAMRAADNQMIYRETVRGVAARMSMWASLAPKPLADQAGNGAHIHVSLWDPELSVNTFSDPAGRYGLSATAYHFIGGLIAHLPALTALTCGSVNSFRRLAPQDVVERLRLLRHGQPGGGGADLLPHGEGRRGLHQPGDQTLRLLGQPLPVARRRHPRRPGRHPPRARPRRGVNVDPATLPEGSVPRLPSSLDEALDALEADDVLMNALGPLRSSAYLAVKRSEATSFAAQDVAYELFHHFKAF